MLDEELEMKKPNHKEQLRALLFNRQRAYCSAFDSETGKQVLEDLASFCRAEESCFHADARLHAVMEGRREVWIRIQKHLKMDSESLWKYFAEGKVR